eukprot:403354433
MEIANKQFAVSKTVIKEYTQENISEASSLIQQGKLVAFPTETVYGLGANALNAEACQLIFTSKERPLTDPLIVHVHSLEQALSLIDQSCQKILQIFKQMAAHYWPGPLTMVVKAHRGQVPNMITAQTGFVGLRMPNHPIALDLIKSSGLPIAAPSANKFGHVSPTKAEHVYKDFHVDSEVFIIDGGSCSFGIESTVLKITYDESQEKPFMLKILRRGGVSQQNLNQTLQSMGMDSQCQLESVKNDHYTEETENLEAPGQFLRHYSPDIDSYLFNGLKDDSQLELANCVLLDFGGLFLSLKERVKYYYDLSAQGDYNEAINVIYDQLRWAETKQDSKCVLITNFIELLGESEKDKSGHEHKEALFDRIFRATSGKKIS